MAGRKGKMSGTPFHIEYHPVWHDYYKTPIKSVDKAKCEYRNGYECMLKLNKNSFKKQCAPYKCKFYNKKLRKYFKKNNCAFSKNKRKCLIFGNGYKNLDDCASFCDYFKDIKKYPKLNESCSKLVEEGYTLEIITKQCDKDRELLKSMIKKITKNSKSKEKLVKKKGYIQCQNNYTESLKLYYLFFGEKY